MAKHIGKRHQFSSLSEFRIAYHAVVEIECRHKILQSPCLERLRHGELHKIEAVIGLKVRALGHCPRNSIQLRLRVAQSKVYCRCLEHVVRMLGRETKRHAAVYDIFAEPCSHLHYAVFGHLVVERIVIERPSHSRKVRIIVAGMIFAYNLLKNHSHFFLVNHIACGIHVGF